MVAPLSGTRIQTVTESQIAVVVNALLIAMREALFIELCEAKGDYYYEEITLKRWVLGDGGVSGNCELCNDNANSGWVDMDDIFEGSEGDIDEPPALQNARRRQYQMAAR